MRRLALPSCRWRSSIEVFLVEAPRTFVFLFLADSTRSLQSQLQTWQSIINAPSGRSQSVELSEYPQPCSNCDGILVFCLTNETFGLAILLVAFLDRGLSSWGTARLCLLLSGWLHLLTCSSVSSRSEIQCPLGRCGYSILWGVVAVVHRLSLWLRFGSRNGDADVGWGWIDVAERAFRKIPKC